MKLKPGQIIKSTNGFQQPIETLSTEGDYILYRVENGGATVYANTEKELKEAGYQFPEEQWEPEVNEIYWLIDAYGQITSTRRYNVESYAPLHGFFKDKEAAEKALQAIRVN